MTDYRIQKQCSNYGEVRWVVQKKGIFGWRPYKIHNSMFGFHIYAIYKVKADAESFLRDLTRYWHDVEDKQ